MATAQSAFDFDQVVPDVTFHRHHGNRRSVEANARASHRKPQQRETIAAMIEAHGAAGMTSQEIERLTGWAKNRFSGRISELKAAGVVKVHGAPRNGCDVLIHCIFVSGGEL